MALVSGIFWGEVGRGGESETSAQAEKIHLLTH